MQTATVGLAFGGKAAGRGAAECRGDQRLSDLGGTRCHSMQTIVTHRMCSLVRDSRPVPLRRRRPLSEWTITEHLLGSGQFCDLHRCSRSQTRNVDAWRTQNGPAKPGALHASAGESARRQFAEREYPAALRVLRRSDSRSVFAVEPDQLALDPDPVRRQDADLIGGIGGLERDRGAAAAEAL